MALSLAVLWPDTHRPYHHVKANKLLLKVVADLKPQEIILLGDFADFYAVNSHGKHPMLLHTLQEEIESVNKGLDEIDKAAPQTKKVYLEGNHEHRLERFISHHCPALFGITECERLFKINDRPNWRWISYGPEQAYKILGSKLIARHEPLGSSAKASVTKAMASVVYGHIHRIESFNTVSINNDQFTNFSVGWLGDQRKKEVFGYTKHHQQWQLGFGLVWVDENKNYHSQTVQIQPNVSCVVNGKEYRL